MAQLVSTTCTSLSVAGSAVWTAANSTGQGSGIDADKIGGYNPNFINPYNSAQQHGARWIVLETLNTGAGALSTFYPYIINGARNADGTCGLDIRRTSVHQDGTGYGCCFNTYRYRAGTTNFWEVHDNWGSAWGGYYPFVAKLQCSTTDNQVAIWIRGGLTYYYRFHSAEAFTDTTLTSSRSFSGTTISTASTVEIPSDSHYYQHNLCSQGYSLGQSAYRWNTVFTVNAINASSDANYKENYGESLGLKFVMKLKPKSYTLKQLPNMCDFAATFLDTRRQHGLVAQEVKEAMDELNISEQDFGAFNNEDEKVFSLRYDEFVPVLIKAVQQQLEDVDDLENRISLLEAA